MRPTTPIVPGMLLPVTRIGEGQEDVEVLPAFVDRKSSAVLSRWRLSWRERIIVLLFGDIYVTIWAAKAIAPIELSATPPVRDVPVEPTIGPPAAATGGA